MRGIQSEMSEGKPGEKGNFTPGENSNGKGVKNKSKVITENTANSDNTNLQEATTSSDTTE